MVKFTVCKNYYIVKIKKKIIVKVIICIKYLAILYTEKIDLVELTEILVENEWSKILVKFTRFLV